MLLLYYTILYYTTHSFAPLHSTTDPETGKSVEGLRDLTTKEQVRAYFERHFPDAIALMPGFEEEYLRNPACVYYIYYIILCYTILVLYYTSTILY